LIVSGCLAWYAEFLLKINLKILPRKTGTRLNFKIAFISLHIYPFWDCWHYDNWMFPINSGLLLSCVSISTNTQPLMNNPWMCINSRFQNHHGEAWFQCGNIYSQKKLLGINFWFCLLLILPCTTLFIGHQNVVHWVLSILMLLD
jgi:hypothetical protein